jgi:hypothetical protein
MTIKVFIFVSGLGRAVILINTSFYIMIRGNNTVQCNAINGQDSRDLHSFLPDSNFIGKSGDSDWTETVTGLARMITRLTHDINCICYYIINLHVIRATLLTRKNWSV